MFNLNSKASQTIEVDLDIPSTENIFIQALEKIGKYKARENKGWSILLTGKSRYGLQAVPIVIQLDPISNTTTRATIGGNSDDYNAIGLQSVLKG